MKEKARVKLYYSDGSKYTCRGVSMFDDTTSNIRIRYRREIGNGFITQKIEQNVPKGQVVKAKIYRPGHQTDTREYNL